MKKTIFFLAMLIAVALHANERPAAQRVVLNAEQPTDPTFTTSEAYRIINAALGGVQGNGLPRNVAEVPDCNHVGYIFEHIRMVFDEVLDKYVFEFLICRDIDLDVVMPSVQLPPFLECSSIRATDRQRNEIKTDMHSPRHLKGYDGDTIRFNWKFWIPSGFVGVNSFTHLYQVKPVGGDVTHPIFSLTVAVGGRIDVRHVETNSPRTIGFISQANRGTWLEVDHWMVVGVNGWSRMKITDAITGRVIYEHDEAMLTLRPTNTFIRPKWGIYRSLQHRAQLRDETARFANFVIEFGTPQEDSGTEPPPSRIQEQNLFENFVIVQPHGSADFILSGTPKFSGRYQIELISMTGAVLRSTPYFLQQGFPQEILVCGRGLPSGIYLIRISTAVGQNIHRVVLP